MIFVKGYKQTETHKRKIGDANKISLRGQRHSPKTEFKKGFIPHNKGKIGEFSTNWKGGLKASKHRHYEKNKQQWRFWVIERRARLHGVGGSFSVQEWETLKAQYNWTCPSCKISEPKIKLTIDHIIPLIKGGSNNIENIQPLCGSCNKRKSTKIIKYAGK